MKTNPIRSVAELRCMAHDKKSVEIRRFPNDMPMVHPASFLLNWSAAYMDNLFRHGVLFEHVPAKKFNVTQDTREWVEAVTR
jgi:hypothetical protein